MATVPIKIPSGGESISEAILSRWLKADGEAVKEGEPILELETDKASTEIPADSSGVLRIQVQEGETVNVGSTVGEIDPEGAASAQEKPASETKAQEKAEAPKPAPEREPEPKPEPARPAPATGDGAADLQPSPAVRRLAEEKQVDLAQVEGTGRGGRITKEDILDHLEQREVQKPETAPAPEAKAPPAAAHPERRSTRHRMSGIRQRIAQRLVEAQQTAAILTTFNEADLTRVMDLRARYKESYQKKHGVNLGFMSFFVKAAVEALKTFPAVNGRIEGNEIVHHHYYDIGVAVSTERGLLVPVVRDCENLGFADIEKAIADYAKKARENRIEVSDLQGGTFTITNGGVFGSLLSTPILNPPQSGILGMHSIQKRPVVLNDQIVIRPMMYLALSYDHRIIDGREAVTFLVRIKECIENPERMLLDI